MNPWPKVESSAGVGVYGKQKEENCNNRCKSDKIMDKDGSSMGRNERVLSSDTQTLS